MNSELQVFTKGLNKNIKLIQKGLHESPELFVRQIQLEANGDNIGALLGIGSYKISREMILVVSLVSTITIGTTAVDAKLVHPLSLIVAGIAYLTATMITVGTLQSALQPIRYSFIFYRKFFRIHWFGYWIININHTYVSFTLRRCSISSTTHSF
nr:spore germination protein [Gottfriedia acidiceleris]